MPELFSQAPVITTQLESSSPKSDIGIMNRVNNIEPPFSQYQNVNNVPYSSKFFETSNDVSAIEQFVLNQISSRGMKDSISSYEQIMNELFDKLGLNENNESSVKYEKVFKYISMIGRDKSKEDWKRELIKREKEAQRQKEEKENEAMAEKYKQITEKNKQTEKQNKEFQLKLKTANENYGKLLQENKLFQSKIQEMISNQQARINDINYLNESTQSQRAKDQSIIAKLESDLNGALTREQNLITKHNQLKSLI